MSNQEFAEPQSESGKPGGLLGRAARHMRRLLGETGQKPSPVTDVISNQLENALLNFHQEKVGALVMHAFNRVDKMTADGLGYDGNIRDELLSRLRNGRNEQGGFDMKGLDPAITEYMRSSTFACIYTDDEDNFQLRYEVDGHNGLFSPKIDMVTEDGTLKVNLHMGPDHDRFDHITLRQTYAGQYVRTISTFHSNYFDVYAPPYPLIIEHGRLGALSKTTPQMIYSNLDTEGNVSLLDGQRVQHPDFSISGRYHASDNTITRIDPPEYEPHFPYALHDNMLTIGDEYSHAYFPVQTNVYTELARMTLLVEDICSNYDLC